MFKCTFRKFIILYGSAFLIGQVFFVVIFWNHRSLTTHPFTRHVGCACKDHPSVAPYITEEENVRRATEQSGVIKKETRDDFTLLVVVLSTLNGKERRDAIRRTWYSDDKIKQEVLLKFVIGTMGVEGDSVSQLQKENVDHGDLLLLSDLVDSFANLTRKVLNSYIWAAQNVKFSYLLKCDDDTFVVLSTLLSELKHRNSTRMYYWGFFDGRATAKKVGKYQELDWFLCDKYLPYALGGGYVLSSGLVELIALNSAHLKLYINEDVSVGAWLAPYDIERNHDVRFDTEYQSRGCSNVYIVTHKQPTRLMIEKHDSLQQTRRLCKKEVQYKPSYIYDWSKPPSECCKRQVGIP